MRISTIILLTIFLCLNASAATFIVTNTNDSGPGSLRQAISDANVNLQADTITFESDLFSTPQIISLTTGELQILRDLNAPAGIIYNLSIVGPGADLLTIDANNQSRIFFSDNGSFKFSLSGVTVKHGFSTKGGAIWAGSSIEISNSVIRDNVAAGDEEIPGTESYSGRGGGLYLSGGVIRNSVFDNNVASGVIVQNTIPGRGDFSSDARGGAIYGPVQIIDCTFTNNVAQGLNSPNIDVGFGGGGGWGMGGAVYFPIAGGSAINSRFLNNSAIAGNGAAASGGTGGRGGAALGGAVYSAGARLLNSTFSNNFALAGNGAAGMRPDISGNGGDATGGAIYENGNGVMTNLTIVENSVTAGNGQIGGNGLGGGIYLAFDNYWRVVNTTVTDNAAIGGTVSQAAGVSQGGGIFSGVTSSNPNFRNNIVADNSSSAGVDVFGSFPGAKNNLIRIGEGSTGLPNGVDGNIVGTSNSPQDPMLGPLSDNGGVSQTRALLAGSPAIDAGNNSIFNPFILPLDSQLLLFDQRNFRRISPIGGAVDIGAYEFGAPSAPIGATTPDLRTANDTGSSNTDNVTNTTSPLFDISNTLPGAILELLRNNVVIVSKVESNFSDTIADPNPPLDGTVQYTSRQTIGGVASDLSAPLNVTFDNTPPTGTLNQAASQADPTRISPINFTAIFSEPVSGPGTLSFLGSTANVTFAFTNSTTSDNVTWNLAVSSISSNGSIVIASLTSFQDIAGNSGIVLPSIDNSVTLDNVRPTVTINQAEGQSDPTMAQPVNFSVVFSEPVTGFTSDDVALTGSSSDVSQAIVNITGGPSNYNVAISGARSSGLIRATVRVNSVQDGLGNLNFSSTSVDNSITLTIPPGKLDFDGDGKTDLSIFRPNGATGSEWWYLKSSNGGNYATQFGTPTDKLVAADYTGDGKADIAFFRPSTGFWYILRSEDSSFYAFPFGANGDIPAPADFDGDGKADAAVFRPSTATWFIQNSGGGTTIQAFGAAGDVPVVGDYDGDGKADIAIFRPNGATGSEWWILRSTAGLIATQFGTPTDKTVPGDYTGDGKADIAIWRPSNGQWYILRSEDLSFYAFPFGSNGDIPVPGDYDGDGKADAAVFRPSSSTWFAQGSTSGTIIQQFGSAGDVPVPSEFVR